MPWWLGVLSLVNGASTQRCSGGCVNHRGYEGARSGERLLYLAGKMFRFSYLSPKTEVRESKIHGRGLFATADIVKDEIVAVKGGHIVDRKTLREKITPRLRAVEIQIDDDLFIAPVADEERELSMLYLNHSCSANLGVRGQITFVAMRDIRSSEELTHDWATTDDDDYSIECKCGAPNCRKILTGKDWQRPELQRRYAGYFSAYLARKIELLVVAFVLAGMVGCAQVKKPAVPARAATVGLRFDQVGWVSLYAGEPCTPQIMFDFHASRSTVWLAAPRRETKVLTDAAKKNQRLHILGKWRRGEQSQCSYVEVTGAEFTR